MKTTYLFSFLFLVILLINGCKSNPTQNNPIDLELRTGQIKLNFDKNTIPDGIVIVKATLTRENHNPIIADLNITSDTTATILIQDITIGSWHLLVQAFDNNNSVAYEGETTVTINENQTTTVNLVLQPNATGLGNVLIYVSWGGAHSHRNWIDNPNSPIFFRINNSNDAMGVASRHILFEDNIYRMWFTTLTSQWTGRIFYATSSDGIYWQRVSENPVITVGSAGSWDTRSVGSGPVIKVNGHYRIYYGGRVSDLDHNHIGMAVSQDGIVWEKFPTPIIYAEPGWQFQLGASDIIKIDGIYHLYYYGYSNNSYKIGLATSLDGVVWNKYPGNPILSPTKPWEGSGIYHPTVYFEDGLYKMVYMTSSTTSSGLGMAYSLDGKNWTKYTNNPVFKTNDLTNNWAFRVGFPSTIKIGDSYRLYYSGRRNDSGDWALGFAE